MIAGQTRPDDFSILLNGHWIGRVMYYRYGPPGLERWTWSTQTYPSRSGAALTLHEALADLKAAVSLLIVDNTVAMAGSYQSIKFGNGDVCNLYSMTKSQDAIRQLFDIDPQHDKLGNAQPFTAIWPKYEAPVVRRAPDGVRELVKMKWGFLTPQISKKTGKPVAPAAWNNARDDKVATNGLWRDSFRNRRCLIPATSFREAKGRSPATDYWFALTGDDDRPLFAFAGLWRSSDDILTHTMITTVANEIVKPIHPTRMPVILDPCDYDTWMNGSTEQAISLLRPFPADRMRIVLEGVRVLEDEG